MTLLLDLDGCTVATTSPVTPWLLNIPLILSLIANDLIGSGRSRIKIRCLDLRGEEGLGLFSKFVFWCCGVLGGSGLRDADAATAAYDLPTSGRDCDGFGAWDRVRNLLAIDCKLAI